jgi:hypothetical protein
MALDYSAILRARVHRGRVNHGRIIDSVRLVRLLLPAAFVAG